jgi:hypothetical protein
MKKLLTFLMLFVCTFVQAMVINGSIIAPNKAAMSAPLIMNMVNDPYFNVNGGLVIPSPITIRPILGVYTTPALEAGLYKCVVGGYAFHVLVDETNLTKTWLAATTTPELLLGPFYGNGQYFTNLSGTKINLSWDPSMRAATNGNTVTIQGPDLSAYVTSSSLAAAVAATPSGVGGLFVIPATFGATGDGVTDDTAALQNWINNVAETQSIGLLPPAPGGWYKITYPLTLSNWHGIKLIGGGGQFHQPGNTPSASQFKQFTVGAPCFIITNAFGTAASPPDNVHIESIAFVANTYTTDTNSVGLIFAGSAPDSDNCTIDKCMVKGFRRGIVNAGAAILNLRSTIVCYNGDGYYQGYYWGNQSPVLNANYAEGCSFTHNYSNAIFCTSGRLTVESSDLVGYEAGVSHELLITNSTVALNNVNTEHLSPTEPAYIVHACNLEVVGGLHQTFASAGANTYMVVLTNFSSGQRGAVYWSPPSSGMVASDGCSFLESTVDGYTGIRVRQATNVKFIVSGIARTHINYIENFNVPHFPNLTTEPNIGLGSFR